MSNVRTRFAPSPTGSLHIGSIRTALYAWAYAKHNNGTFVLRIEDTDTTRSTKASEKTITDGLSMLGLNWDEGPFYQMQRLDRYNEVANMLIAKGYAYKCYDQQVMTTHADEDPNFYKNKIPFRSSYRDSRINKDEPYVVRLKIPNDRTISFYDVLKKNVSVNSNSIEDWILIRQNGIPTYNFAVVVDDIDVNISHVIRGDDHVNNTPKQVLLYEMLQAPTPVFAHLPLVLDVNGKKLSKRAEPLQNSVPTTLDGMLKDGVLPITILNYLSRLGWAHGNDEFYDMHQFVSWFNLENLTSSPAKVDGKKLHWLNAQHLKALRENDFKTWAKQQLNGDETTTFINRLSIVRDMLNSRGNETATFRQDIDVLNTITKNEFKTNPLDTALLGAWEVLRDRWSSISISTELLEIELKKIATESNVPFKDFAISIRTRITDAKKTPSLSAMMLIMPPNYIEKWLNNVIDVSKTIAYKFEP